MGAIIATVFSEFSVTVLQIYFIRNQISIRKLFNDTWKYSMAGLVMFFIVRYLNSVEPGKFMYFALQICIGGVIYIGITLLLRAKFLKIAFRFIKERKI